MSKELKYNKQEEQDSFIQSLNLNELRNISVGKSILTENSDNTNEYVDIYDENDFVLQNMSVHELKGVAIKESTQSNKYTIQYKVSHTGLDKKTILLIEKNKYKATLEQLISYCKGMKINYREFIPEFF